MTRSIARIGITVLACGWSAAVSAQAPSMRPDTAFKLATFDAGGQTRVGLILGTRVLDIAEASAQLERELGIPSVRVPADMRGLIEEYESLAPRLYQIANHYGGAGTAGISFAFDAASVSFRAPIRYPWNLLAAAANYRAHAEGMAGTSRGFDASVLARIDPDRDAPVLFAKSPRSCIIDPGEPYYIPSGRTRVDWEGELAIIIGKPAYLVTRAQAPSHIFGYSIIHDVSDRGGRRRDAPMFPGPNWFDGKSVDRGAPFGPVIVPREFLPNAANLRVVTRVNGIVKQDGSTRDLIWSEAHLVQYASTVLTLYPGDVIATGTPAGTGAERNEFLKPGDLVSIEVEGIGTLTTPVAARSVPGPPLAAPRNRW